MDKSLATLYTEKEEEDSVYLVINLIAIVALFILMYIALKMEERVEGLQAAEDYLRSIFDMDAFRRDYPSAALALDEGDEDEDEEDLTPNDGFKVYILKEITTKQRKKKRKDKDRKE